MAPETLTCPTCGCPAECIATTWSLGDGTPENTRWYRGPVVECTRLACSYWTSAPGPVLPAAGSGLWLVNRS